MALYSERLDRPIDQVEEGVDDEGQRPDVRNEGKTSLIKRTVHSAPHTHTWVRAYPPSLDVTASRSGRASFRLR